MKDHDLLEAVGGINEKYINKARKKGVNKKVYLRWIAAVACVFIIATVIIIPKFTKKEEGANVDNASVQNDDNIALDEQARDSEEVTVSEGIGDYPSMIMVGGRIYKDTYEVYQNEIDEESILKSVSYNDGYPEKDGEQNFDRGNVEYVVIDSDTVICRIDDQWRVFKMK